MENPSNTDKEQSWDDFWAFETSGVREFIGSEIKERQQKNIVISKNFEETVEKREDGYYLRLPWKNNTNRVPDNKGMAVRRLQATLAMLERNPDLLQKYHETIAQQLHQHIIEEVDESEHNEGAIIHYLPHYTVVTSHKETTKLRIVYDASSHMKMSPSFNDVLHQRPVFLPQICDILLRFRIGNVAMTSDIEKAFLQIRLHEQDRDATRFLWIRDISQPLTPRNTAVYRFTRVTFGLNCSPFLLAGTNKYHLENYGHDPNLAREIRDNTYVDNVTTSKTEEAILRYNEAKQIFKEMGMNLRGFLSNDRELMSQIKATVSSENTIQKVLGITWHAKEDQLLLSCRYPGKKKHTKRSIAELIATTHDPLGWLAPLTLRGKQFLQNLWNFDYTWNEPLSQEHRDQWEIIASDVNNFEIAIPRKTAERGIPINIIIFADASKQTMATCAYLVSGAQSHLLMGKSKLSSLKENTTIPKLELSALTMATRIAHSLFTALRNHTPVNEIVILSGSEIALSWIRSRKIEKSVKILVKNRVKEIRRIVKALQVPVQFGHVPTEDNPSIVPKSDCLLTSALIYVQFL